jgi:hypothetical protein
MNNKIYIKLIDVEHYEIQDFLESLRNTYKVTIERNKDTYSLVEETKQIYTDILDMKDEFGKLGKLIMVYKGGL